MASQELEEEGAPPYEAPVRPLPPMGWAEKLAWGIVLFLFSLICYLMIRGFYLAARELAHLI